MLDTGKERYHIQSVDNALNLLEVLCDAGGGMSMLRLVDRLDMNKNKVWRLLATFENRGYIKKNLKTQEYHLGLQAVEMGQKALMSMELLHKAKSTMGSLARECNEAVYLAVRRNKDVLFLDFVDTTQAVRTVSLLGKHFQLDATAAGNAILGKNGTADQGKSSAVNSDDIQGATIDQDTLGDGITCLAVPLLDSCGNAEGALCIVGPTFRMPSHIIEEKYLPSLKRAGDTISVKIGYAGPYYRPQHRRATMLNNHILRKP